MPYDRSTLLLNGTSITSNVGNSKDKSLLTHEEETGKHRIGLAKVSSRRNTRRG